MSKYVILLVALCVLMVSQQANAQGADALIKSLKEQGEAMLKRCVQLCEELTKSAKQVDASAGNMFEQFCKSTTDHLRQGFDTAVKYLPQMMKVVMP